MGPIWATRIWDNPYGTHAEPGCTPHMGPIYACLLGWYQLNQFNQLSTQTWHVVGGGGGGGVKRFFSMVCNKCLPSKLI